MLVFEKKFKFTFSTDEKFFEIYTSQMEEKITIMEKHIIFIPWTGANSNWK